MGERFTPGPWRAFDNRDMNDAYWIGPEQFLSVAEVRHGADDPEYGGASALVANAHLIASAPDLYAALRALRILKTKGFTKASAREIGPEAEAHAWSSSALAEWADKQADAALSRARGETDTDATEKKTP